MKVRFIEWMPFSGNAYDAKRLVPYAEMRASALGASSGIDMMRRNGGPLAAQWASSRPCPSTSVGRAIACA